MSKNLIYLGLVVGLILIGAILVNRVINENEVNNVSGQAIYNEKITKDSIKAKFSELQDIYKKKEAQGYDMSEARYYGKKAKQAYDEGDYEKVNKLLDGAFGALEDAKKVTLIAEKPAILKITKGDVEGGLSQVEVASQYRYVTDWVSKGRNLSEVIKFLNDTKTEFIFQGWITEWQPCTENCSDLPSEENQTRCESAGYSYAYLRDAVMEIRGALPEIIFGGGMLTEFLYPETIDPVSGEVVSKEKAWEMALNPEKWNVSITKAEFQCKLAAEQFHWTSASCQECTEDICLDYDPKEDMRAYYPDITNPDFRELFLNLAKKQIDCGVDALWIDALFSQAKLFKEVTNGSHPAAIEAYEAASEIVDDIHSYGHLRKGGEVYIITWPHSAEFPFPQPDLDAIMISPSYQEVKSMQLNERKWDKQLTGIREKFGEIPIFARIDYGEHDKTPLAAFSQELSVGEANEFLRIADDFFSERDVKFIYPLHGGYMGVDATNLAYGWVNCYDSIAPEFQTYEIIKELTLKKAGK